MNVRLIRRRDNSIDIIAKQGTTWEFFLQLKRDINTPFNLTNWYVRSHIRKNFSDPNPVAIFQVTIENATQGLIKVYLPADITAQIPAGKSYRSKKSQYVYDIEVFNIDSIVFRPIQGKIFVDPEATK